MKAKKKAKKARAKVAPPPKPSGYVFGRPTVYKPEFCQQAIDLGAKGKSFTQIAAHFFVSKETLYRWIAEIPDFRDAMAQSRTLSQSHWEELGYKGMQDKSIDGSLYSRSMSARFPDDWSDRSKVELTGKDGESIKVENTGSEQTLEAAMALVRAAARSKPAAT